ncbi:hypothetical protein R3P38DRAFT_3207538 [Favolaschia claudopus]|uniref:Uncharacterized protein n=1 Tax=Favolaschia claudopus TaxID=2862362 RepID=A0AAW0AIK6_9AGAR
MSSFALDLLPRPDTRAGLGATFYVSGNSFYAMFRAARTCGAHNWMKFRSLFGRGTISFLLAAAEVLATFGLNLAALLQLP